MGDGVVRRGLLWCRRTMTATWTAVEDDERRLGGGEVTEDFVPGLARFVDAWHIERDLAFF